MPRPRRRGRLFAERLEPRDVPAPLTLAVSPDTFAESAGPATGTVTRTGDLSQPLTVTLSSSDTTAATVPASVVIPAGQASATFPVTPVNDPWADGPQAATLTATAGAAGVGLDTAFGSGGYLAAQVRNGLSPSFPDVAVTADGKILAGGQAMTTTGVAGMSVSRLTAAGALDPTFGTAGTATVTFPGYTQPYAPLSVVLPQPDGKVVVAGTLYNGGAQPYCDFAVARFNADGTLDTTFGTGGRYLREVTNQHAILNDAVLLPDGRMVFVGVITGTGFAALRLTAAGVPDPTFGSGGLAGVDVSPGQSSEAYSVAVTGDGRVVLAGDYAAAGGGGGVAVVRLTTAGAADPTFSGDGVQLVPDAAFGAGLSGATAYAVKVLADGRTVLAGSAFNSSYAGSALAVRLTAAGNLDPTFSGDGVFAQRLPGSTDDAVLDLAVDADGRVLLAASAFQSGGGVDGAAVARLTAAGTFDPTFDGDGLYNLPTSTPAVYRLEAIDLLPDGRLVALGGSAGERIVTAVHLGVPVQATAVVTVTDDEPALTLTVTPSVFSEAAGANAATGTVTRTGDLTQAVMLTLSSSDATEATVPASVTIPAGQASAVFPVAAVDDTLPDGSQSVVVRAALPTLTFTGSGAVPAFGQSSFSDIAYQPDGKIVLSGRRWSDAQNAYDFLIARLLPDGTTPDPTFGVGGAVSVDFFGQDDEARKVAVLPSGDIVVGGDAEQTPFTGMAAVRLKSDGTLDPTFGTNGRAVVPTSDGTSHVRTLLVQADEKVVLGGFKQTGGAYQAVLALYRLTATGALDAGFGSGGLATVAVSVVTYASGLAVQPDGKLLVVGTADAGALDYKWVVARLLPTGQRDTGFGTSGLIVYDPTTLNDAAVGVSVLADGRVVVSGSIGRLIDGLYVSVATVARYTAAGQPDPTFGTNGVAITDNWWSGVLPAYPLGDGRLLIGVTVRQSGSWSLAGWVAVGPTGAVGPLSTLTVGPLGQAAVGPGFSFAVLQGSGAGAALTRYSFIPGGGMSAAATVTVTDDDPSLTLTIAPTSFGEAAGPTAATATLVRGGSLAAAVTATLASSTVGRVTVPATVSFAVGQSTVTFPVAAVNNSLSDGDEDVLLSASIPNNQSGVVLAQTTVRVTDDEGPPPPPIVTLSLTGPLLEHAGPNAGTGTLTRSGGTLNQPLTVSLSSDKPGELTVPASVTFPAGQTTVSFPLSPVDETTQDGDQTVTVTASLPGSGTVITGPFVFRSYSPQTTGVAALVVQPDGKLLALAGGITVWRFNALASGALTTDTTWGTGGAATATVSGGTDTPEAMFLYPDGRVLVAGTGPGGAADIVLARFTAAGQLDTTFDGDGRLTLDLGTGAYNEAWDVTVTPAGQIVIGATVTNPAPTYMDFAAVRLNPDGSRDTGFGTNGVAYADFNQSGDRAYAVAVQPDGKILLAGEGNGSNFAVARFTPTGALDLTFDGDGRAAFDLPGTFEGASDVLVRPDGRILLAGRVGRAGSSPPVYDPGLVQLTPAGALDPTFGVNGVRVQGDTAGTAVYGPVKAALQADGRVVVVGTVGSTRGTAYTRLMRFSAAGTQENAQTGQYSSSVAEDVAITAAGDVYVAYRYGTAGTDGWVDRYLTTPTAAPAATATATVVVRDNEPFTAVADSYVAEAGGPLVVSAAAGVRANDVITRPISPAAELVSGPAAGTVVLNPDGSFTFTPAAGQSGTVTFSYRLRDGVATTAAATVSVRITGRPTAVPDAFTTDEDTPLTVGLVPPAAASQAVRLGFDEATAGSGPAANTGSLGGTAMFAGAATRTGSPAYTVGRTAGAVNLSAGSDGYVSLGDVDALDAQPALTVAMWVRLTAAPNAGDVIAEDWRPTVPFPPNGSTGWSWSFDTPSGSPPVVQLTMSKASGGSVVGTIDTITPPLAVGQWVFLAFTMDPTDNGPWGGTTYHAVSQYYGTTAAPLVLGLRGYTYNHLDGPNDAPLTVGGSPYPAFGGTTERTPPAWFDEVRVYRRVLSAAELEQVRRTTGPQLGVLANDTDPDPADTLSAVVDSPPAHGLLVLATDGSFTYTPDPDYFGTDSFTYRTSDGSGLSDPTTVTLTVRPRPDLVGPPVANDGAATRSRVTSLALTFDTELDTTLLAQPGVFVVRRLSDGATVGSVTASPTVTAGQTRVTLSFAGLNTESGSLADGRWVVEVNKDFVRTPAGVGLAASVATAVVHRFFGDGNGDGLVNNSDLFAFRLALNLPAAYRADFDHSADGLVNNSDLFQFRLRLNTTLP